MRVLLATLGLVLSGIFITTGAAQAQPIGVLTANTPFYSNHDGRCLDSDVSSPTHNGTKVQIWNCNGWNNQKWTYYSDNTIRSTHDGRCLDSDVSSATHNGTKVQIWDCNGWNN